ncbi:MAG: hypothetical protein IJ899_04100 [Blautia sp.]|nr:hypothetical protein [Blautia sp.]
METSEIIRTLCKAEHTSVTKLEETLGFSNGSLTKSKDIGSSRLFVVAKHFGVSMEYLMTGEDASAASRPHPMLDGCALTAEEIELLRGFRAAIYPVRKTMLFQANEALKGDMEKSSSSASNAETA